MKSGALAFLLVLFAAPAFAGLEICNDTDASHEIAVGYKQDGRWVSEGWWAVAPSDCVSPIEGDLRYRFYYYHAKSPDRVFQSDRVSFCTQKGLFTIGGDKNCEARGYDKSNFARIDTGKAGARFRQNLSAHSQASSDEALHRNESVQTEIWGAPFSGDVVFHECSPPRDRGKTFCKLVGSGRVFTVNDDSRTSDDMFVALRNMRSGTPLYIQGDWVRTYENSVELVLRDVKERAPTEEDQLLVLLQGSWFSAADSNDQFVISGSGRQNRYGGAPTSMEYLSVMPFCGEFSEHGPYLYAWDSQGGTGLCYEVKEVSDRELILNYLPRGTELHYRRLE